MLRANATNTREKWGYTELSYTAKIMGARSKQNTRVNVLIAAYRRCRRFSTLIIDGNWICRVEAI
jgi:hypothetical protein